jgi:hypothetical protein
MVLNQLGLLLWKHLVRRKNQKVILILEIIVPIVAFVGIVFLRYGSPGTPRGVCHYIPRALPNSGVVRFLQSYVCNINNQCEEKEINTLKIDDSGINKMM